MQKIKKLYDLPDFDYSLDMRNVDDSRPSFGFDISGSIRPSSQSMVGTINPKFNLNESEMKTNMRRADILRLLREYWKSANHDLNQAFCDFMADVNAVLVEDFKGANVGDFPVRSGVLDMLHDLLADLDGRKSKTVSRQKMIEAIEDIVGELE